MVMECFEEGEIENLRKSLGWERHHLALYLQVNRDTVRKWEKGQCRPLRRYMILMRLLEREFKYRSLGNHDYLGFTMLAERVENLRNWGKLKTNGVKPWNHNRKRGPIVYL